MYAIQHQNDWLQDWLKKLGKEQKRKGKRLFMPARICLTVRARVELRYRGLYPCSIVDRLIASSASLSMRWRALLAVTHDNCATCCPIASSAC